MGPGEYVQLAVGSLTEGRHGIGCNTEVDGPVRAVGAGLERAELPDAVVGEHVHAPQRRDRASAVDVAPGHRAGAVTMGVLEDRRLAARGRSSREEVGPLEPVPPEVVAATRIAAVDRGRAIDLLPRVLPDVTDPQITGVGVEGEAPRVP